MKYSLIIATLGREFELIKMLLSVKQSSYDLNKLEIIIVDQNKKGFLDNVINTFSKLNIIYIHSDIKGLSVNRNIGLQVATGDIICFPDDDCKFYGNTLTEVTKILSNSSNDFCMGRIYDHEEQKDIIKKWSKKEFKVNKFNSYFINNSITLFVKKESVVYFDENLGVGANFGSCEDADFIYRILENNAKGIYTPKIEVWHPQPNYSKISLDKVKSYASGFGYFIRKKIDIVKVLLLLLLVGKKTFQLINNIFKVSFQDKYFYYYFTGLINGLKNFKGI